VSHVTVSLALRGRCEIPLATQKKIKAIAKRLGYSPDPMLGALSAYRRIQRPSAFHSNLAWIISDPLPETFYRGDFLLYFEGARERARELGYGLERVHLADHHYERRAVQRMLAARGIKGLLICPVPDPSGHVDLDWARYSAVRFGYSMRDTILHTVTNSQYRTCFFAVEQLVRRGYRRVGYITEAGFNSRTGGHFLGGYLSAKAHFAMKEIPVLVQEWPKSGEGYASRWETTRLWIEKEKPDAIITDGRDILNQLKRWGLRVPEDIGFASVSVQEKGDIVSGMHQNPRRVGSAAVDLLVSLLERQETGIPKTPMHLLIEGEWRDGQTTAPLAKKSRRSARLPKGI